MYSSDLRTLLSQYQSCFLLWFSISPGVHVNLFCRSLPDLFISLFIISFAPQSYVFSGRYLSHMKSFYPFLTYTHSARNWLDRRYLWASLRGKILLIDNFAQSKVRREWIQIKTTRFCPSLLELRLASFQYVPVDPSIAIRTSLDLCRNSCRVPMHVLCCPKSHSPHSASLLDWSLFFLLPLQSNQTNQNLISFSKCPEVPEAL